MSNFNNKTSNKGTQEKKVYTALLPRVLSKAFISVFQTHCFNDGLRPDRHPNKGKSFVHVIQTV